MAEGVFPPSWQWWEGDTEWERSVEHRQTAQRSSARQCRQAEIQSMIAYTFVFAPLITHCYLAPNNCFISQESVASSSAPQANSLTREEFISFYKELTTRPEVYFLLARCAFCWLLPFKSSRRMCTLAQKWSVTHFLYKSWDNLRVDLRNAPH